MEKREDSVQVVGYMKKEVNLFQYFIEKVKIV